MLNYRRICLGERIDLTKSENNKECIICQYWYINHGFKLKHFFWLKLLIIAVLFMALANLKLFIY